MALKKLLSIMISVCISASCVCAFAENAGEDKSAQDAAAALGSFYKMYPVCGEDENVNDIITADLAEKGYADTDVSVKAVEEVYGGGGVDESGNITYYYADPNVMSFVRFASYRVTFELTRGETTAQIEVPVIIYWDRDKVLKTMQDEIIDGITTDAVYYSGDEIVLPKTVDGKKWALISWESSDSDVIEISKKNQQTADTLFDPYAGIVKGGSEDVSVTLTATFEFMLANDVNGSERPITAEKEYTVTVSALSAERKAEIISGLTEKLDGGFAAKGIRDAVTGEWLIADSGVYTVYNDILLPTTRDFGVDGKFYPVKISSSAEDIIRTPDVNNAARVEVLRPAPGNDDAHVTLTVSLCDSETSLAAQKEFSITVKALTDEETEKEKALMERVKAEYFDGIKGKNRYADDISSDLDPFIEVYEDNGELVWVRSEDKRTGHGIVPVPMDGWEELEAWRLFRSSNPAAVTHENLLVSMQKNAKAVTLSSALSSETLGRYGELYAKDPEKYAQYADLSQLYYQPAEQELVIRGTSTRSGIKPMAVAETVDVTFSLVNGDKTVIDAAAYTGLDESVTVYDIFRRALDENGCAYESKGSYIYSITLPDGTTLAEFDKGPNSGWMYRVNGIISAETMSAKTGLKNGDEITVFFTEDYTKETNYEQKWDNTSKSSGGGLGRASGTAPGTAPAGDKEPEPEQKEEARNADAADKTYTDMEEHWALDDVNFVTQRGIMRGVDEDRFAPEKDLSRAMFVTVLYRLEDEPQSGESAFEDVEPDSWYADAVAWAGANGIVKGVSDTLFDPNGVITREQLAALIFRYAQYKGMDVSNVSFPGAYTDTDMISPYAFDAVCWCSAKGIFIGENFSLRPGDSATRAETAAVIRRVIGVFE